MSLTEALEPTSRPGCGDRRTLSSAGSLLSLKRLPAPTVNAETWCRVSPLGSKNGEPVGKRPTWLACVPLLGCCGQKEEKNRENPVLIACKVLTRWLAGGLVRTALHCGFRQCPVSPHQW